MTPATEARLAALRSRSFSNLREAVTPVGGSVRRVAPWLWVSGAAALGAWLGWTCAKPKPQALAAGAARPAGHPLWLRLIDLARVVLPLVAPRPRPAATGEPARNDPA